MNSTFSFKLPCYYYDLNRLPESYKTLDTALAIIKKVIQSQSEYEQFYNYLISLAPSEEEKNIITKIRNNEIKHNEYFREIYQFYTNQILPLPTNVVFYKPTSYIDGIIMAKFAELSTIERYRDIRAGLPDRYYRDMLLEILTDDSNHAHKYGYILYLNSQNKEYNRELKGFTLSELAKYNGTLEMPSYVAINGIVYDVSNIKPWTAGKHFGLIAGNDLTKEFKECHDVKTVLEKLPKVGRLKINL